MRPRKLVPELEGTMSGLYAINHYFKQPANAPSLSPRKLAVTVTADSWRKERVTFNSSVCFSPGEIPNYSCLLDTLFCLFYYLSHPQPLETRIVQTVSKLCLLLHQSQAKFLRGWHWRPQELPEEPLTDHLFPLPVCRVLTYLADWSE